MPFATFFPIVTLLSAHFRTLPEVEVLETEAQVSAEGTAQSEALPYDEHEVARHNGATVRGSTSIPKQASSSQTSGRRWKKRITGLHRSFVYESANSQARFEQGAIRVVDLIAPSAVTLLKDAVAVIVHDAKRYQRYYEVIGFASELMCEWQEELTSLALPMIIMSRCHPIDSRLMIKK